MAWSRDRSTSFLLVWGEKLGGGSIADNLGYDRKRKWEGQHQNSADVTK